MATPGRDLHLAEKASLTYLLSGSRSSSFRGVSHDSNPPSTERLFHIPQGTLYYVNSPTMAPMAETSAMITAIAFS